MKIVNMKTTILVCILIFLGVLLLDQGSKIWVKTTMIEHEDIKVFGNWAHIYFVENSGMAFSMELPGQYGKLALTSFRIIAIFAILYYIVDMIKSQKPKGLIFCATGIFAGALGNLIDSIFYGKIFTDSYGQVATIFPENGYAGWLQGNVVDMLWFPMISGTFPLWFPVWGGESYLFFSPVFNVADAAITVSVFFIIIFQKSFFPPEIKAEVSSSDSLTN